MKPWTASIAVISRAAILVLAIVSILGVPNEARADDDAFDKMMMVITGNTGPVHRSFPAEAAVSARPKLNAAIEDAMMQEIETFLIDAGNATSPFAMNETYYDLHLPRFLRDNGYAVSNQTGVDHVNWGLSAWGVRSHNAESERRYLGAFNFPLQPAPRHITPTTLDRKSETVEGGIRFVSISSPNRISGATFHAERSEVADATRTLEEVVASLDPDSPRPLVVVFSDLDADENDSFVRSFEDIDLLIEVREDGSPLRNIGRTFILGGAHGSEIRVAVLTLDEDGRLADVEVERQSWIDADELDALWTAPPPTIGMSVRPATRVAERLGVDVNSVNLDVFRDQPILEFSPRENVFVYRIAKEDGDIHAIRTHHSIGIGWMTFDALIEIDPETNTIVNMVTNLPDYPVSYVSTAMADVFRYFYNKPHDEWEFPEELIGGIEMQAKEVIEALRKTLIAHEMLYSDQTD